MTFGGGKNSMKRCTKCGKLKPLSEFYRDSYQKSGYRPSCKICSKKQTHEYRNKFHLPEVKRIVKWETVIELIPDYKNSVVIKKEKRVRKIYKQYTNEGENP